MPAGSLHSSLPLIDLQNYQGMQRKKEENQKNSIKHGFYEGFVSKQYGFCFQMPINAFMYILKHLNEVSHDRTKKSSMKCKEKYSNFK